MSRDVLGAAPVVRRWIYQVLFAIAAVVPLVCTRLLAYAVGHVYWFLDARGRRIVHDNLAPLMPGASVAARARCVRRSFVAFAFMIAETFNLPYWSERHLRQSLRRVVDPWAVRERAPLHGPLLFLTVHCNWSVGGWMAHRIGLFPEMSVLSLPYSDAVVDAHFARVYASFGGRNIHVDGAPLAALRAVKRGEILAIVGDRDYSGHGLDVPFAGCRLALPPGPAALALQSDATLQVIVVSRVSWTRFDLFIHRPFSVGAGQDRQAQITAINRRLAQIYERHLRASPYQWVAFHPVWSKRPASA